MSPIAQVFGRELREMLRDKRVRTSAFIIPPLLIVGILFLLGTVISSIGKPKGQRIHVVRSQSPVLELLRKNEFTIVEVPTLAEGKRLVKDGKARLLLDFPERAVDRPHQLRVDAYRDPKQQTGEMAFRIVSSLVAQQNKETLKAVLDSRGIPQIAQEAIKITETPIQVGDKTRSSDIIVSLLPYLIILWAFQGGFSIASDLVAGEKDKNTLETLLITPIKRTEIVLGKFFALATVCLFSSLSSLAGLAAMSILQVPATRVLFKDGLGVSPLAFLTILLVLLPTVALFASLLLGVSAYAKTAREAQTHMGLLFVVILMPAIFSQFIGMTDAANAQWVHFVPVLNTANTIRTALLGKADVGAVVATVVISLALALLALRWAVWLFNREQVLARV